MSDSGQTSLASGIGLPDRYEVELPSGRKAQVLRHGKGKHLELAERMLPQSTVPGSMKWNMAYIAVKCLVDGNPVTYEDVEEMADLDVLRLVGEVLGKDGTVSGPVT